MARISSEWRIPACQRKCASQPEQPQFAGYHSTARLPALSANGKRKLSARTPILSRRPHLLGELSQPSHLELRNRPEIATALYLATLATAAKLLQLLYSWIF